MKILLTLLMALARMGTAQAGNIPKQFLITSDESHDLTNGYIGLNIASRCQ